MLGVPWLVEASLQCGVLLVSLFPLFIRIPVVGLGPTLMEYALDHIYVHIRSHLCPYKITFTSTERLGLQCVFWGHTQVNTQ